MMIQRFKKNPVEIEAIQFIGDLSAVAIVNWVERNGGEASLVIVDDHASGISIETLEGVMRADLNDWVIRGLKGEFYPCKPDIFASSYTEVTNG